MLPETHQSEQQQRDKRDKRERVIIAAELAPGRASIAPVNQFEETGDDSCFVAQVESMQHQPFGELVECEHNQSKRGDATI